MLVDLLHLSRSLRRSPASAGAAILTLSLTLGAGASIFEVVDAALLTPPFTNPDALVTVSETPIDEPTAAPRAVSYATFMGFALLAVVLGGIGLFGVVAHDVACRRAELAIRIALGADPMRILSATLGQGALMVASGLAVGALLSIWAARALSGLIFATDYWDVLSVGLPAAVLIVAGAGADLPAARRAARTDPLIALRSE